MEYRESWYPAVGSPSGGKNLTVYGEFLQHKPPRPLPSRPVANPKRDLDYDKITDIYNRLERTTSSANCSDILVNTSCDCILVSQDLTKKQKNLYKSQDSNSSDSEEEEDVDIIVLLRMLRGLQTKPVHKISTKPFMGVLDSFRCKSVLTDQQITEIWRYLDDENLVIKELALLLLSSTCTCIDNARLILEKGVFNTAESILSVYGKSQLYPATVRVINSVVAHEDLKDLWIEPVLNMFIPAFLAYLRTEAPLDHKYPMCCFFQTLSRHEEFLGIIEEQVLPIMTLIKDASSKLKEVYTGILMSIVQQSDQLPTDLSEQGIIPTAASLIKEGPCTLQCQAFSLFTMVAGTDSGIANVVDDHVVVPYTLCCIKHSKCRKVKVKAIEVLCKLTCTRRIGICKDIMVHISQYLIPSSSDHSSFRNDDLQRSRTPSKSRYERESQLWKGLDKLTEIICEILCKEAMVERDSLGSVIGIRYKPCIDMCTTRLNTLKQCIDLLHNVCIWPASKSKQHFNKIDLSSFTDSESQRIQLCKINRCQAQALWDTIGVVIIKILQVFSTKAREVSKLSKSLRDSDGKPCHKHTTVDDVDGKSARKNISLKVTDKIGAIDLFALFEESEIELIVKVLELLLVMSLCTCTEFKDFMKKEKSKASGKRSEALCGRATRSDTCVGQRPSSPEKLTKSMSAIQRSSSPTKLTETDITKKLHQDLKEKEAATERRLMRKCLYEAGLFAIVSPFIYCTHMKCQNLACQIMRCNVQPLDDRVYSSALHAKSPTNASANTKLRPMSAVNTAEADRKLNIALHRMSPHIAEIMKDAIGVRVRPLSATIPGTMATDDSEVKDRLSEYVKTQRPMSGLTASKEDQKTPVFDLTQPLVEQCRQCFLKECGPNLLHGMFSPSLEIKRACILLLQDIVHYGNVSIHMKLSEFGCVQKLVDFLRVNTDNELMEITGLMIVQIMVSSDPRLKQVFNRHGGTRLLMAMSHLTTGNVKKEVSKTLKTVTYETSTNRAMHGNRPSSAPATPLKKAPDIWDHIQGQWNTQDRVEGVLKQWYTK